MNTMRQLASYADIGQHWRHWYDDAREYIWSTCHREGWDMDRFIGVLAVTSPRVSVQRNWSGTLDYFRTGVLPRGFIRSTRVALDHYEQTGGIRGPKTSAFAKALGGEPGALVLDTWMAKAFNVEHAAVTRKYNRIKAMRRMSKLARSKGWTIAETQAAVWAGICITNGVRPGNLQDAAQSTSQMSMEF